MSAEQWEMGYDNRGDYLAGEPPGGSPYPDQAPYPREWTTEQRLAMTWYAHDNNIRVDYDPRAEDEGSAGWYAAANAMERNGRWQRAQVAAIRDTIRNPAPDGQLPLESPPEPEPQRPADPSEPRYPRQEFQDW